MRPGFGKGAPENEKAVGESVELTRDFGIEIRRDRLRRGVPARPEDQPGVFEIVRSGAAAHRRLPFSR